MNEYDFLDVTEDGRVFRYRCYEVKPDINPAGYSREGNSITVYNLTKICRDNQLNLEHMWSVAKRRAKSCKGWRKA